MAEMESLQTALTLLKHIVTMPNVPKEHWESLQGTVDDLKTLSELHHESHIKNVAKKLHQLIDANVQVIKNNNDCKEKAENCMKKTKEYQAKMGEMKQGCIFFKKIEFISQPDFKIRFSFQMSKWKKKSVS